MLSKLNALKCQSNGSESDGKREKPEGEDEEDEEVSDHMYEKLPSYEHRTCKCHTDKSKEQGVTKPPKISLTKRISKWKMECPGITTFRNIRSADVKDEDEQRRLKHFHGQDSENSRQGGKLRGISALEHFQRSGPVRTKVMTVNVEREDGNLGITLRGGFHENSDLSRPVVITYVKPDGPAARLGTIKPGDRLLAVDGVSLQGSTLTDAQKLLKQPSATTLLTIEYNVNILENVEHTNGPLLVEIEKSTTQELGLTLFQTDDGIVIERVKPGSLADRCGALHVGDEILAVNSTRISGTSITLDDVMKVLECEYPIVRLEILPSFSGACSSKCGTWKTKGDTLGSTSSGMSTIKSTINRKNHRKGKVDGELDYKASSLTSHGISGAEIALTHSETLHTTLSRENGTFGLRFVDAADGAVLISSVTQDGPAERSQCLHPGDRLLSINHRSIGLENLKAKDVNDILDGKSDDGVPPSKLSLHTEFDVLDTVVPSSGIFIVKLVKRGTAGLGITMTASKTSGFIVSEMKKGSIAHRAGSLMPGDRLLAINNIPLDHCSVENAAHIFHQSANIVTLKVQRDEGSSDFRNYPRKITYTVDLQRYGGALGITIAGSEEPSHPITISGLTAGGLAEQTGVIHIGDEILAINNHSLLGEPLSRAHMLLQNSTDLVTLKLSRPLIPICRLPNSTSPILPSSIDSAVESWDSSHLDLASPMEQQRPLRDSHDGERRTPSASQQRQSVSSNLIRAPSEMPEPSLSKSVPLQTSDLDNADLAILDEITSENLKIKRELDLLSLKLDQQRKSKLTSETCGGEGAETETVPGNGNQNSCIDQTFVQMNDRQTNGRDVFDNRKSAREVANDLEGECRGRESMMTMDFEKFEMAYLPETRNWCTNQYLNCEPPQEFIRSEFQSGELYEVTLYKDPIYEDFGFSVSDGLYEKGVFINRIRKGGPADLSNMLKPYDRILQVNKTFTQDFDCCLTVPLIASAGDSLVLLVARNTPASPEQDCFGSGRYQDAERALPAGHFDAHDQRDFRRILV